MRMAFVSSPLVSVRLRLAGALLPLALSAGLPAPLSPAGAPPGERGPGTLPPGVTTVPIQLVRGGVILVPAEVNGHRGVFVLDPEAPVILLNSEYVTPTSTGGLDTNTAALAADTRAAKNGNITPVWTSDSVQMRIGTLTMSVTRQSEGAKRYIPYVAVAAPMHALSAAWGGHVLGILGLPVMAPYETVLDYAHQRLTLIPVDSVGRRRVAMPAYTPTTTVPFTFNEGTINVEARVGGVLENLEVDLGFDQNELSGTIYRDVKPQHLRLTGPWKTNPLKGWRERSVTLDHLDLGGRSYADVPFFINQDGGGEGVLGGEFFWRSVGIIGFNVHARHLVFYQASS